jgi:hypothetical protein
LPDRFTRNDIVAQFLNEHIDFTPKVKTFSKKAFLSDFDAYIVGSDQIWRYSFCKHEIYNVFLDFVKSSNCKRIAYAASFGSSEWQYPSHVTAKCKELLSMFNAVSVRERSGVELCLNYLGTKAVQVIDPTLLVPLNAYTSLCVEDPIKEKYLLAYILDITEDRLSYIQKIAELKNLQIKLVTEKRKGGISVTDWLTCFRNASYIITDSFHGTVFSIIFNNDFESLGNSQRGQERFVSLLSSFGLLYRFNEKLDETLIESTIDWKNVNHLVEKYRNAGLSFLKTALS